MMNIHLSRPGGQREGPFTLDEINRDLAANKYRETDYWAWYEGLTEWVPLHQIPGIVRSRATEPAAETPTGEIPQNAAGDTEIIYREETTAEDSAAEKPASEEATSEESPSEAPEAEQTQVHPKSGDSEIEDTTLEQSASEPAASEEVGPEPPVSEELEPGESLSESGSDVATREQESASQESSPEEAREEAAPEEPVAEGPLVEEPTSEEPAREERAPEEPAFQEVPSGSAEDSQPDIPPSLAKQLHSGMSFEALEHILLLSSGDAQAASRSAVTSGMLEAAAGEDLDVIKERIPRDAMGGCVFLEKLRGGGSIPELAWRAASTLKPELVRQAREGLYRICVRTYPIETGEMVALFLFYNKQML